MRLSDFRQNKFFKTESQGIVWHVPYWNFVATIPGPSLLIISGVHGNERVGAVALNDLVKRLLETPPRTGKITVVPVVNVPAFSICEREWNGIDLNRAMTDEAGDHPSIAIGRWLRQQLFPEHQFLIDIHSGNDHDLIFPYYRADREAENSIMLGSMTGLPGLLHNNIPGSMRAAFLEDTDKCAITIEAGGSRIVDPASVLGVAAMIESVGANLGLLDGPARRRSDTYEQANLVLDPDQPFNIIPKLGAWVDKGEPLAKSGEAVYASPVGGLLVHIHTDEKTDASGFICGLAIPT